MIRSETLNRFAKRLAPADFDPKSFLACYGMAECSLAVSFAPLGNGLQLDHVDSEHLATHSDALRVEVDNEQAETDGSRFNTYVNCGTHFPDHEVEIRAPQGRSLPERRCGAIHVRGPSVINGYLGQPEASHQVLSEDGWFVFAFPCIGSMHLGVASVIGESRRPYPALRMITLGIGGGFPE